jgi:hypothetical protein
VQSLRSLRFKLGITVLSLAVACLIFTTAAQGPSPNGVDSIRAEELRQKLTYIASETFKGRGNGTPDLDAAAEYIAGIFQKNGLKPAGDNGSYYQHFNVYSARLGEHNELHLRMPGELPLELRPRQDFIPEYWSVSGTVSGPLAVVEDNNLSTLKGKVAVEVEDRVTSDDPEFPTNASEGLRLQNAGAIGVIIIQSLTDRSRGRLVNTAENFRDDLPVRLTAMASADEVSYPQIPVAILSADQGRRLLEELKRGQSPITATLTVDIERRLHPTQNVLALIPGSDSTLKNDVMVVGAHYDHDGEAFGQIWYGADDNGSGTAALLELAEAFGQGAPRPSRSVLLCAWAGEEKGLLGSRYYVNHPVFSLNRTVAMFQMDMIGRNEEHSANRAQQVPEEHSVDNANSLNLLGSAFSPDLKAIISRVNNQTALTLRFRYDFAAEDLMRRSDQWSFLQKGIPAIFFFTGLHPDYHTPRDTPDRINYPKLEKIAKLVYLTAFQVANSQNKPQFVRASAPGQKQ